MMPRFRNLALGIKEVNMGWGLRDLVPHGKLSFAKDICKKSFTKSKGSWPGLRFCLSDIISSWKSDIQKLCPMKTDLTSLPELAGVGPCPDTVPVTYIPIGSRGLRANRPFCKAGSHHSKFPVKPVPQAWQPSPHVSKSPLP